MTLPLPLRAGPFLPRRHRLLLPVKSRVTPSQRCLFGMSMLASEDTGRREGQGASADVVPHPSPIRGCPSRLAFTRAPRLDPRGQRRRRRLLPLPRRKVSPHIHQSRGGVATASMQLLLLCPHCPHRKYGGAPVYTPTRARRATDTAPACAGTTAAVILLQTTVPHVERVDACPSELESASSDAAASFDFDSRVLVSPILLSLRKGGSIHHTYTYTYDKDACRRKMNPHRIPSVVHALRRLRWSGQRFMEFGCVCRVVDVNSRARRWGAFLVWRRSFGWWTAGGLKIGVGDNVLRHGQGAGEESVELYAPPAHLAKPALLALLCWPYAFGLGFHETLCLSTYRSRYVSSRRLAANSCSCHIQLFSVS